MLVYFNSGERTVSKKPQDLARRVNWEFFAVTKGRIAPLLEGARALELREQHMWVMPPMLRYTWVGDGKPARRMVFHFSSIPPEFEEIVRARGWLEFSLGEKSIMALHESAREIKAASDSPGLRLSLIAQKHLAQLCLVCVDEIGATMDFGVPLLDRARLPVDQAVDYFVANLPRVAKVEEIAHHLSMSSSQLRRFFSRVKGKSPKEVFLEHQLERATQLASSSSLKLDRIAEQSGFLSASHLCRNFKLSRGISIHKWRQTIAFTDGG